MSLKGVVNFNGNFCCLTKNNRGRLFIHLMMISSLFLSPLESYADRREQAIQKIGTEGEPSFHQTVLQGEAFDGADFESTSWQERFNDRRRRANFEHIRIICESRRGSPNRCPVDGLILNAQLVYDFSHRGRCNYGYNWGFDQGSIWVNAGCKGEFVLRIQPRWTNPPRPRFEDHRDWHDHAQNHAHDHDFEREHEPEREYDHEYNRRRPWDRTPDYQRGYR